MLIGKYGDTYLLPGGKIEDGETLGEALKREIKEEYGFGIDVGKLNLISKITSYQELYPKVNGGFLDRKITTYYCLIEDDIKINYDNIKLSDREKKFGFKLVWVPIKDLKDYLTKGDRKLREKDVFALTRKKSFDMETLEIIEQYKPGFGLSIAYDKDNIFYDKNRMYIGCSKKRIEDYRKENKFIDMHTHSIYSDGDLTPDELIKKALKSGINTLSITDHDTLLGLKNITNDINHEGVELIKIVPGIELSAKTDKGRMHILGYDFDINNKVLNDKMDELKNNSIYSVMAIINQLKIDYGIIFDNHDIKKLFDIKGNIGRPHIAKLLIKYGYCDNVGEAFDKYLVDAYKKTKVLNKGIPYEECINLIKNAGGISVLAHPNQLLLDDEELEDKIKEMISNGLDGIEVYHSGHSKEETEKYLELANKYNLLISGGSDYHGKSIKPDIEIGETSTGKIKRLSLLNVLGNKK